MCYGCQCIYNFKDEQINNFKPIIITYLSRKKSLSDEDKAKQTKKLKRVIFTSKIPGQNESSPLPGEPHNELRAQHHRG